MNNKNYYSGKNRVYNSKVHNITIFVKKYIFSVTCFNWFCFRTLALLSSADIVMENIKVPLKYDQRVFGSLYRLHYFSNQFVGCHKTYLMGSIDQACILDLKTKNLTHWFLTIPIYITRRGLKIPSNTIFQN